MASLRYQPLNKNYQRGARKEQKIVREARDQGLIAFRSAGSHSPIDVCIIDSKARRIEILQCKHSLALRGGIEPALKEKLEKELGYLSGTYEVVFKAV